MMRTMYINVARPIAVAGAQSARATSFSWARRSFVSDPYVGNRDERRQDKSQRDTETWKSDKNPQDWKQSGERNFEGMQGSMSDRARDQTDKGRFENESGGQGSSAAREQAAREQASGDLSMNKGQINQGINNASFGMSGQAKDDPNKAQEYNSSWAKDNSTTPTDKAKNYSSRDSNSFGMLNEKAKAKDNNSFDRPNSGDKNSMRMNAPKGKEDSSFGINDLNDQARENQFKMSGSGERDSNSTFGMDERSSTRDRVREGELNASSEMKKKQTNPAFGLGNPKRDFSIAQNTTKDKAASAAQSVKETVSSAAQTIKEKASSAAQTIKEKAGNAEKNTADYGKQAAEKVQEKAADAKEYLDKKSNEKR